MCAKVVIDNSAKMLPEKVKSIRVNTGNLISCKEFKRKAMQSPTEEVFESVSGTLSAWVKTFQPGKMPDAESMECVNKDHVLTVDKEDRINLKLTVKVFLNSFDCETLKQAINEAMGHLDVSLVDSLILALPPMPAAAKLTLEDIQPLWKILQQLVEEGKVVTIGISDLDTGQLIELYQWAQVKPSVNQVNLESCCVMPPEMTAFAKDNDIQLLTHNDPKVLLPQEMIQTILTSAVQLAETWKAQWIVRYSVVVKCRGIIQNKGYILSASKELPLTNGPC